MKETVGLVWHQAVARMKDGVWQWASRNSMAEYAEHSLLCNCETCEPEHFKYETKALRKTRKKHE